MLEQLLHNRTYVPLLALPLFACAAETAEPEIDVGVQEAAIVLGAAQPNAQFPWIVELSGNLSCHGVLIEPRWVLTAAHCIDPVIGGVTVSYRRTDPVTGVSTRGSQVAKPSDVVLHPEWSRRTVTNDIGLIHLPAPLDSSLVPDPLLRPAELARADIAGEAALIASTVRHDKVLPVGSVAVLRAPVQLIGSTTLTSKSPDASLCQGDSGSGYVATRNGKNVVIGIASTSANSNCEPKGNYEFDASKVSAYVGWIESQIGAQTAYRYVNRTFTASAPAAAGAASGISFAALGVTNIVYRAGSGQLQELWQQGMSSGTGNLTAVAGAPTAAGDPTSFLSLDGYEVALYRGSNGHVHSLYWNTGAVGHDALSEAARAPKASGNPYGWVGLDGWTHVAYRAQDGSLEELWWYGAGAPGAGSLTRAANAPLAAGDPAPYINTVNGQNIVAYRGSDGHIHTLYWFAGAVSHDNLSWYAGAPKAAGDPTAYYRANDDSHQITYRGVDGHIHELWWTGNAPVQWLDLTAAAGVPTAAGDPTGHYSAGTNTKYVFYRTSDKHLHQISWTPGQPYYQHFDLTLETPAPLLADKPSSFVVEATRTQHVVYRGTDNAVHDIHWQ